MPGIVRVYSAVSLDGFLAGENDDLSWLEGSPAVVQGAPDTMSFEQMMARSGSMLMGRRTFDVVQGFDVDWPYGDVPVLVATNRPIASAPPTVRPVQGTIRELCSQALQMASGRDVYLDGGGLIGQALDANLIDEMVLTIVPVMLGRGVPLYQGDDRPRMTFASSGAYGDMLQVRLTR